MSYKSPEEFVAWWVSYMAHHEFLTEERVTDKLRRWARADAASNPGKYVGKTVVLQRDAIEGRARALETQARTMRTLADTAVTLHDAGMKAEAAQVRRAIASMAKAMAS